MSQNIVNMVHETEAQRRHARVRLPARLFFHDTGSVLHSLKLLDLSASGFGVQTQANELLEGQHHSGELVFKLNASEFRLPIKFSVLHRKQSEQRAGCEFNDLGIEEISILRLFITKYLAGDLTSTSDILSTLSRDNFVKSRNKSGAQPLKGWKKARALMGAGMAACVGVLAFAFIVTNLYQHFFVTRAVTAVVNIDRETVQAPANGYFELMVKKDDSVEAGMPIATITSSVLEYLKTAETQSITPEDLEKLAPGKWNSLVKSPCNCRILDVKAYDSKYARQGDALFDLARTDSRPYVTAVFDYLDADDLPIGKKVLLQFPGERLQFYGTIIDLNVDLKSGFGNVVTATIQTNEILSLDRIRKPVNVSVAYDFAGMPFAKWAVAKEHM